MLAPAPDPDFPDLATVRGQEAARRALEVAAAGGHGLLLMGPPGAGKTLLARCLPGLLPPLTPPEAAEVARIAALIGRREGLPSRRPFRSPHPGTTPAGMVGGGPALLPGEASLAHAGVLFLDDLPAFRPATLAALRQPLEEGWVTLARGNGSARHPARFLLLATMRPCPCGRRGDPRRECLCSPSRLERYHERALGPLRDGIDLCAEVPALTLRELRSGPGEPSAAVAARVAAAREIQRERFGREHPAPVNAALGPAEVRRCCPLDRAGRALLAAAFGRLGLSARQLDQALKVARTIADLAGAEAIRAPHLAEALQHRPPGGRPGPSSGRRAADTCRRDADACP